MKSLVISTFRYLGHKPWPPASQLRTQISVSLTSIQSVPLHSTVSINVFGLSDFLMNSVACVRSTRFQNCKRSEWNCVQMYPRPFLPFFAQLRRAPSLIHLLACLFNLSSWKRKGNGCYVGYEFRFDLVYHSQEWKVVKFTMLTANTSAFYRDDTKKCQITVGILGGSCRDAPVVLWEGNEIV